MLNFPMTSMTAKVVMLATTEIKQVSQSRHAQESALVDSTAQADLRLMPPKAPTVIAAEREPTALRAPRRRLSAQPALTILTRAVRMTALRAPSDTTALKVTLKPLAVTLGSHSCVLLDISAKALPRSSLVRSVPQADISPKLAVPSASSVPQATLARRVAKPASLMRTSATLVTIAVAKAQQRRPSMWMQDQSAHLVTTVKLERLSQ